MIRTNKKEEAEKMRKKMMMPMVLSILAMGLLVGCDGNKAENTGNVRTESVVTNESSTNKKEISSEKAKEIALKDAGVKEADIKNLSVKREVDDGQVEYDVSFEKGQIEYEYEILAENGKILTSEKDTIDD